MFNSCWGRARPDAWPGAVLLEDRNQMKPTENLLRTVCGVCTIDLIMFICPRAAALVLDGDGRMRSAEHHILRHGGGHIFPGVSNPAVYIYTVVIFWFDWRFLFILRHLNCWGFSPSLPRWTIPENYCANPPKKIADRNSSFLLHGILRWGNILRWPS